MLKSLFWISATGVALIAGIALHHGDDIERGARQIEASVGQFEDVGGHFEREFDEAEEAVDNGADAEQQYEEAFASALVSSGLFTLDNIDDIDVDEGQRLVSVDNNVEIDFSDVVRLAREQLETAQNDGSPLPQDRGIDGDDISEMIEMLDDMGAFDGNGNGNIRIQ